MAAGPSNNYPDLTVEDSDDELTAANLVGPGAKKMVLINNGDKLSRGRPYVFNPTKTRTWSHLLEEFADRLKPTFGAVRKVYTPRRGTEVTDLHQLHANGVYVLSGTEKFKQIPNGYNTETILNQHFNHHQPKLSLGAPKATKELPVAYSGIDMPDLRKASTQILTVNVFRNGDDVNPPVKVMLKKFDLWNFMRAKDVISAKVKPSGGFCKSIRTIDGTSIHHVADLKHNGFYVAVGPYEKFRSVDYSPDGRPTMAVHMNARTSFVASTYQDPEGRKRRRTFVVRLKKNDGNPAEDGEETEEEDAQDERKQVAELENSKQPIPGGPKTIDPVAENAAAVVAEPAAAVAEPAAAVAEPATVVATVPPVDAENAEEEAEDPTENHDPNRESLVKPAFDPINPNEPSTLAQVQIEEVPQNQANLPAEKVSRRSMALALPVDCMQSQGSLVMKTSSGNHEAGMGPEAKVEMSAEGRGMGELDLLKLADRDCFPATVDCHEVDHGDHEDDFAPVDEHSTDHGDDHSQYDDHPHFDGEHHEHGPDALIEKKKKKKSCCC